MRTVIMVLVRGHVKVGKVKKSPACMQFQPSPAERSRSAVPSLRSRRGPSNGAPSSCLLRRASMRGAFEVNVRGGRVIDRRGYVELQPAARKGYGPTRRKPRGRRDSDGRHIWRTGACEGVEAHGDRRPCRLQT